MGQAVRERRLTLGLTQAQVANAAGVSQTWVSKAERGRAASGSVETWAALVAATGGQLVGFVEDVPGTPRPRDQEHLLGQELVIRESAAGSWSAEPERALRSDASQGWRYVDVLLRRRSARELAVVEIWNRLEDVGDGLRGLATKVERVRAEYPGWGVSGLLVARRTKRNREIVARLPAVFGSALPASSDAWLRALRSPDSPMPQASGLLWTDTSATRLVPARPRGIRLVQSSR